MRPSQASAVLRTAVLAKIPAMMWGPPGIGKSDLVRQLCEDHGLELRDVRISQLDSVDLRGIPHRENGRTVWNPPDFLPHDLDSRGILFLDEINSGSVGTMAAAYQLVLDRRLGNYELPAGWAVLAAGNRLQDRSIVNQMPMALRNRFIHIEVEVNLDDWRHWALTHGVHSDVLGFISSAPDLLNEFDVGDDKVRQQQMQQRAKDARAFATPRSWAFLSRLLSAGIPAEVEYETYGSVVGEGPAAKFVEYMKYSRRAPNLDNILMNPGNAPVPEEPATLYATVSGLAVKSTSDNFERVIQYADRLPTEFGVTLVKDSVTRIPELADTKAFNSWAARNAEAIT